MVSVRVVVLLVGLMLGSLVNGQWRGVNRSGHFDAVNLKKEWPQNGPEKAFEVIGIGDGWSSAVATEAGIFVTGLIDTLDYLSCFSLDGAALWKVPIGDGWGRSYPDARNTPVVDGAYVYALSGQGQLGCYNVADGEQLWYVNVDSTYQSVRGRFGVAETPLIVDDLIICTPGGNETSMVAFNKLTGALVWKTRSLGGARAYASAILYEHENVRQVIGVINDFLFAVDPKSGEIQWQFDYATFSKDFEGIKHGGGGKTNCPIFKGYELFFCNGYNNPSLMLTIANDGLSVEIKWISRTLDNHHHGVVEYDGAIYGTNWINNKVGKWVCMDWDTGEVTYIYEWFGKGVIVAADGMFYIMDENKGNVGLLKPDKKKFDLISSFKLEKRKGMFWAHPVIYNGQLFLRYGDALFVYNIGDE